MTSETTPRPWVLLHDRWIVRGENTDPIVTLQDPFVAEDMHLIVRAVNSHDAMLDALRHASALVQDVLEGNAMPWPADLAKIDAAIALAEKD